MANFCKAENGKLRSFEAEIGIQCMQRKQNLGKFQGGNRKQILKAEAEIDFALLLLKKNHFTPFLYFMDGHSLMEVGRLGNPEIPMIY